MTAPALTRAAAAKVNLTLEVTGRREDGYHSLQSLVVFTDVTDTLSFTPASSLSLEINGPEAGSLEIGPSNLILRAARLVQQHLTTDAGFSITLDKRIPIQAGLGGGSADAAAAIEACWSTWAAPDSLEISDRTLAFELGADVPVCRLGRAAMMHGIGEKISPIKRLPPAWLVLVNPRVSVPTKAVFKFLDRPFATEDTGVPAIGDFGALADYVAARQNSLTSAAIRIAPTIEDALEALQNAGNCIAARMSGSGPTCFGLFETRPAADEAARSLAAAHPGWWVRPTPVMA